MTTCTTIVHEKSHVRSGDIEPGSREVGVPRNDFKAFSLDYAFPLVCSYL